MRFLLAVTCVGAVACGGSGSRASGGPSAAPSVPAVTLVRGTITETLSGAPVGTFTSETTTFPHRVLVSAPGYLTRETAVRTASPTVDLIRDSAPFELPFYRQMVRNDHEQPGASEPLRRLADAPRFYLRTVDSRGDPVPGAALALVREWIPRALALWLDWSPAGWEEGTDARPRTPGTILVVFEHAPSESFCGRAFIGATAGQITFNIGNENCSCGGPPFSPGTVIHEVGHAIGFWHVDPSAARIMSSRAVTRQVFCGLNEVSGIERHHAAVAYTRQAGNRDPDVDASTVSLGVTPRVVTD